MPTTGTITRRALRADLRRAVVGLDASREHAEEMSRQVRELERAYPGPRDGGTPENFERIRAFEQGPSDSAWHAHWAAERRIMALVHAAGFRAARLDGRVYVALDGLDGMEQDGLLALPVGGFVDLDAR